MPYLPRLFTHGPVVLAALLLLAGCASNRESVTSRYLADQDVTTYRTGSIGLGSIFGGSGLGSGSRVSLRGWAQCQGQDCQPSEAWLAFALSGSSRELRLASRSISMRADEQRYDWPQRAVQRPTRTTNPVRGEIARISMSLGALESIAFAQSVSGTISDEAFTLSYEERQPLRNLANELGAPTSSSASP